MSKFGRLSDENGSVAAYSHLNGRIGVLAAVDKAGSEELARDIAMQIAATNPKCISIDQVAKDEIDKETEIYKEQLSKEGKPENIMQKIIEGKLSKYFEEICLVEQEYIKDDAKKVKEVLGDAKVSGYVRFSL